MIHGGEGKKFLPVFTRESYCRRNDESRGEDFELFKSLSQMLPVPFFSRGKSRANASERQPRAKRAAALSHTVYPLFQRCHLLSCNFAQLPGR